MSRCLANCLEADNTAQPWRWRRGGQMEADDESSNNIAERCGRAAAHSLKNPENANIDVNLSNSILRPQRRYPSHRLALILTWN